MPRILIVDDESLIREWLTMCLQTAGLEPEEIHQANNGEDALSMLKIYSYDLIFTDITMPKLDGIQLIKAIRELDSQVKLIILTCHDDFSFARSAVKYNVYEYLLKNELTKEEVFDIITRTLRFSLEQADAKKLRNDFLRSLLHQDEIISVTQEELTIHHVDLTPAPYFVIAFYNGLYNTDKLDWSMNQQLEHVITFYSGIHVTLLTANLSCSPRQYQFVIKQVEKQISQYSSEKTHIGQSSIYKDLSLLPDALNEAMLSWELQFFECSDLMPSQVIVDYNYSKIAKQMIHDKKSEILMQYTINGSQLTEKLILDLCSLFITEKLWDSNLMKRTVIDLMEEIDNRSDSGIVNIKDYISSILSAPYLKTVLECITRFFSFLPEPDYVTDYIKDTKEYIAMHYNNPLTLTSMAERVHLSEEYFSRLFKKEVGKNFTEYITEIRMIKAKKLLLCSDFNINEIGEMVGIQNPSYFSNQFKRYYGMSPKAIRENRDNS